jgi:hypothetical protein
MLDSADLILHLPSDRHLVTRCGLLMDHATVGPLANLRRRCSAICTACFTNVPA